MPEFQDETLFRKEAVLFSIGNAMGQPIIIQPIAFKVLTFFIATVVVFAGAFLYFSEYARKTTVPGYLEPTKGLVRVYAHSIGGIVHKVFVTGGSVVKKGQPLIQLNFPSTLTGGEDALDVLLRELTDQELLLEKDLEQQQVIFNQNQSRLEQRKSEIDSEVAQLNVYKNLQARRTRLSRKQLRALSSLHGKGAISETQWLDSDASNIEQEKVLATLDQQLLNLLSNRATIAHELEQLPIKQAREELLITLRLSEIRQRATNTRGRSDGLILAPESGTITFVQVNNGELAPAGKPLMALVPSGSSLRGVLLLPSNAVGFVEPNMPVRITLDSFPHQQFGTQKGTLETVSQAPISPADLAGPVDVQVPVYIARIALDQQYVIAYGEQQPMQPGMLLSADIILERRSLLDWVLEPLYSLRGRTH